MEYSKSDWDLLLWPRAWHKRINTEIITLIPGFLWVGLFDLFMASRSIFKDYILTSPSGLVLKVFLFLLASLLIGFLDVFCFAWPIGDLCRYVAKRSGKFIVPGFHVIFMKSYAYSHLLFYPILLLRNATGLQEENLVPGTPVFTQFVIRFLLVLAASQIFWQMGILLRTISVKSKLDIYGKLIAGAAIFLWFGLEGDALRYLIDFTYHLFGKLFVMG